MVARKGRRGRSSVNEDDGSSAADTHVGNRVRLRRLQLGMSLSKLARSAGLSFQQIQKYERGLNRIAAGRLHSLARILEVPVSFFFEDMNEAPVETTRSRMDETEGRSATAHSLTDPLAMRETMELVRAYYRIVDPSVRRRLFEIVKALGSEASLTVEASTVVVLPSRDVVEPSAEDTER